MHVIVVESPAKAKTLRGYLGDGHAVIATRGHVKDLPAKDGSVDPARDFAMVYATKRSAARTLGSIAAALREADALVLATDPDREGEAIAWQVLSWLQDKGALEGKAVERVVFHEITAAAVRRAMAHPRALDMDLVRAQQARRALGLPGGLQPVVAVVAQGAREPLGGARAVGGLAPGLRARGADRDLRGRGVLARDAAAVMSERGESFTARLGRLDGQALDRLRLRTAAQAAQAVERIRAGVFHVTSLERGEVRRNPVPPFTTSTLQQEASRQLGFGVRKTMQLAQRLYEGVELDGETAGLITYMRTDSVALSKTATRAARKIVRERFGQDYLPPKARVFRSRARQRPGGARGDPAHRPRPRAGVPRRARRGGRGGALRAHLEARRRQPDGSRPARPGARRARVGDRETSRSPPRGAQSVFDGFLRVYREGRDEDGDEVESERPLPAMAQGERAFVTEPRPERRFTRPAPRYTEASLVRKLEELGIGRPSTYASIVGVLRERGYVLTYRRRFVPTERGRVVTAFLETWFARWVAYGFTTDLEAQLDRVAEGATAYEGVLHAFWGAFEGALEQAGGRTREEVRAAVERALEAYLFGAAGQPDERACPSCAQGRLGLEFGRYGPFIGCSRFPDCRYSRPLATDPADRTESGEPLPLGTDPDTGLALTLRRGRYGRYVQRGEHTKDAPAARAPRCPWAWKRSRLPRR